MAQVLEPHRRLAPPVAGHRVERLHAVDLERHAQLQVVLQVRADAGQIPSHLDAVRLQLRRVADAGEHQQLRRGDRTAGEDHLASSRAARRCVLLAAHLHAGAAQAVEVQPERPRLGEHLQVAAVGSRPQERLRGVPALAALLVDVEVAAAEVGAAVEIVVVGNALLRRCLAECIEDVPAHARLLHAPFVAGRMPRAGAAVVVLVAKEVRQHLVPAPARVGAMAVAVAPAVVVLALAAHVDHAVDRRTAAEHLAARIADRATVETGLGFGLEAPVGALVADAVQVADRHADPDVVVVAAGLEQRDARAAVGAQAIGEQAAGRAGADDDDVVGSEIASHASPRRPALKLRSPGAARSICRTACFRGRSESLAAQRG